MGEGFLLYLLFCQRWNDIIGALGSLLAQVGALESSDSYKNTPKEGRLLADTQICLSCQHLNSIIITLNIISVILPRLVSHISSLAFVSSI